ncbi:hypothetical protein PILCRDRAFT_823727 [Piloderma croceum F 1598]|uniref:Thaumatin-like protein n=1 Tax=Piloderma croceum (strain F 1598) TaxID=765440 RepID=A0A0C3AYS4_PILCF|nr:hypothetical protein PILCRDRAFT_823727 [Piloderma croceum F 1598]
MLALLLVSVAARVAFVLATHTFTLVNHCSYGVPVWVDNAYSKVPYNGAQPGTIGAGSSVNIDIPNGWNSRICHNADGAKCVDDVTKDSLAEFNLDSGGLDYYDISNIEGYSIAQEIQPHNTSPYGGCQTVECTSATCPCSQAYPPGDESGCGNDEPVKSCPSSGAFTITYCP